MIVLCQIILGNRVVGVAFSAKAISGPDDAPNIDVCFVGSDEVGR